MAMLDDEFGGLMDDPSTQPGGAQERFIMGLLGSAANKKGYASLGLPLLSLLLRDQMQGFDAERKKQAQMAQVAKALQAKRLQTQMEHEQQKMAGEQEQQRQGGVLADILARGGPIQPNELLAQGTRAGSQGLNAAKLFLENQAKAKAEPKVPPRPSFTTQGGEAVDTVLDPATNSWVTTRKPITPAPRADIERAPDTELFAELTKKYGSATKASASPEWKAHKTQNQIIIAGAGAQARVEGSERGYQAILAKRLDRIQKEAEAATAGRPLDPTTRESVSQLINLRNQGAVIDENYDPEFLGPIRGTAAAFEARRRVGSYIGTPLGQREVMFRQALNDVQATITYALSGKQINEAEATRLKAMLPAASDEPQVFQAGMRRFDNEAASIIETKIKLGKTPRAGLPAGAPTPTSGQSTGGGISPERRKELEDKYGQK